MLAAKQVDENAVSITGTSPLNFGEAFRMDGEWEDQCFHSCCYACMGYRIPDHLFILIG
jgi:hypothetical protein